MKLRFVPVPKETVPACVRFGKWRTRAFRKAAVDTFGRILKNGTQTCRVIHDDGSVEHYAYVQERNSERGRHLNGKRVGPWLRAIESRNDTELSG